VSVDAQEFRPHLVEVYVWWTQQTPSFIILLRLSHRLTLHLSLPYHLWIMWYLSRNQNLPMMTLRLLFLLWFLNGRCYPGLMHYHLGLVDCLWLDLGSYLLYLINHHLLYIFLLNSLGLYICYLMFPSRHLHLATYYNLWNLFIYMW